MFEALSVWIQSSGPLVYALAPLFTFAVAVLPIPAEIPAMLNGVVFGPVLGSLITWLSALAGAQVSFELGRRFGRPLGSRFLPARALDRADKLVESAGWPALLALRLVPTVAFTALNWGAGITAVPRGRFVWTTALGIIPGAIAFTTTGAGLFALLRAGRGGAVLGYLVLAVVMVSGVVWWCWPRLRRGDSVR